MIRFGLPDRYVTHGKPDLLREEVGLTAERVVERVLGALDRSDALHSARLAGPTSSSDSRSAAARRRRHTDVSGTGTRAVLRTVEYSPNSATSRNGANHTM